MPSWSTATTRQPGGAAASNAAPQVGPGRVAVDAQQRADGRRSDAVVQQVPGAACPVGVGDATTSATRPGRAPGGSAGAVARRAAPHQAISRQDDVEARADAHQQHAVTGVERVRLRRPG